MTPPTGHADYPKFFPEIFHDIEVFSEGKNPPRNEDNAGWNATTLVLSDGATDKTGQVFDGHTGGELAAQAVVDTCLSSNAQGKALVEEVTASIQDLYVSVNPRALHESQYRFAATMVTVKAIGGLLVVTQVGDSSFRINGRDTYTNNKLIDKLTAGARQAYIQATSDIAGSREFIMPLLREQHVYQNNADSPLGYGVIDGTPVPPQFIRTFSFPRDTVATIELVSDGYFGVFPATPTIDAYEEARRSIEKADPHKHGQYASTKQSDDRTVMIARLR